MRFLLLIVALSCFSSGCQSPYRPSQIPPPGTGTVGRRDPYYQPNSTQLGATDRRSPAYTARSNRDRRRYSSDQQKVDERREQRFDDQSDQEFDDDTLLNDSSSTSTSRAATVVNDQNWRSPELANNDLSDDQMFQASRHTPGFRRY